MYYPTVYTMIKNQIPSMKIEYDEFMKNNSISHNIK